MEPLLEQLIHKDIIELRDNIVRFRGGDWITCTLEPLAPYLPITSETMSVIYTFLSLKGYHELRDRWVEVVREEAIDTLHQVLANHLAYSPAHHPNEEALTLAHSFVKLFSLSGRFFTNTAHYASIPRMSTYVSLTSSTFDAGIVAIDDSKVGILWFQDED